jgi:hypothetical protein
MQPDEQGLEFLDILTVLSFVLQLQNQSKIFGLQEVQNDNNRVAQEIHKHLESQDEKIDRILEVLAHETN